MDEVLQQPRRMSDAEALMWRLEKDPFLSSNVAMVSVLDRPVDLDRLRRRLDRAAHLVPRLHQKVAPSPAGIAAPTWVDDAGFGIDTHLRHLTLPAPGSERQLLDFATQLAAAPFDWDRPLWEFVAVDGLEGGRGALVQKLHHTITDGEGGIRMSMQFLDRERDTPEPPPLDPALVEQASQPAPNPAVAALDLLQGGLRLPIAMTRSAIGLLADPFRLPAVGLAAAGSARVLLSQLGDTERARSPLWTGRSLRRHLEVLHVPFSPTKAVSKSLGGTLNTAFLTVAATAAGEYHRRLGAPVDELRASMAVSTRSSGGGGTNAFSLARLTVPTTEMPIAERFARIAEVAEVARETSGVASLDLLAGLAATLPTSVVTRLARSQTQTVDFATSNVRAAPFPLYIAGSRLLHNYPVGPTAGVAFNLTLMSYAGSLDMGLNMDAAAVEDPLLLKELVDEAFDQLVAAGA
jgi:WS/DGAT/MGAT family acyltransferase